MRRSGVWLMVLAVLVLGLSIVVVTLSTKLNETSAKLTTEEAQVATLESQLVTTARENKEANALQWALIEAFWKVAPAEQPIVGSVWGVSVTFQVHSEWINRGVLVKPSPEFFDKFRGNEVYYVVYQEGVSPRP